jgi:hypothetical protein
MAAVVISLLVLRAPPAQGAERSSTLLLSVAAPAFEAERLEAVVRELLGRLDMQVEMRRVDRIDVSEIRRALGPSQQYFARVWIAVSSSGRARLYLEHGASDRVLVREIDGDASNPELLREELGHILQTAVEGLKAGEEIGAPRSDALKEVEAETARAAPAPVAPAPESDQGAEPEPRDSPGSLRFGPRYEVSWLGAGHFEDGPGAVFGAARPVGFELAGYFRRALEVEDAPVGVRLQTLAARGLVTLELWEKAPSRIRLGAGMGADFVRVSPVAHEGTLELSDPAWRTLAMARAQASYAHRAFGFMELEVAIGVDVDLSDTSYVVQQGSGDVTVFEPWAVRPLLSLGATVP